MTGSAHPRSWLTGHRDGTKIIGHEGAGVALNVQSIDNE